MQIECVEDAMNFASMFIDVATEVAEQYGFVTDDRGDKYYLNGRAIQLLENASSSLALALRDMRATSTHPLPAMPNEDELGG